MTLNRFIADVSKLMSGNIFARALSAVTVILIARTLPPEVYGQYAASLSFARLSSIVFNLGLDAWILKSGGEDPNQLGKKVGSILWVKGVGGFVWLIAITALAWLVDRDSFPILFVALCAASVWFESITATAIFAFKSALRNNLTITILIAGQLSVFLFTVAVWVSTQDNVVLYLWGRLLATLLAAIGSFILMRRLFVLTTTGPYIKNMVGESRDFGVSVALAMVVAQADVTLVAYFLGKEAVGFYAPAITLAMTAFLVPNSIHQVLLPMLSQMKAEQPDEIRRRIPLIFAGTLGMAFLLSIPMAFVSKPLTHLVYGPQYAFSGELLTIFSAVMFFRTFVVVISSILAAVEWQRYRVYAQLMATTVAISGNIFVLTMTTWGLIAVAWVYVLSEAVMVCGGLFFTWQWWRLRTKQPSVEIEGRP